MKKGKRALAEAEISTDPGGAPEHTLESEECRAEEESDPLSVLRDLVAEGRVWFGQASSAENRCWHRPLHDRNLVGRNLVDPNVGDQKLRATWPAVTFGIESIDRELPHHEVSGGVVHEWFLNTDITSREKHLWFPPLFLITALLGQTAAPYFREESTRTQILRRPFLAFVGKRCWPTPFLFQRVFGLLERSWSWSWENHVLLFDPIEKEKRLLTALKLLGSEAIGAVIIDGSGLRLTATRRLQLAAHARGTLCFLLRPPWEDSHLSAAHTRWKIHPISSLSVAGEALPPDLSNEEGLQWRVELFQAKGARTPQRWDIRWRDDSASLSLVKDPAESVETISEAREAIR